VKKYLIGFGIVVFMSLFALKPLFGSAYFPMHDDTQVSRVIVMGKALREGQFPVRWVSDLGYGYGYPIFNFYGPLPYYFGGCLYALGMDAVIATKIMFFVGALLASVFMYIALTPIVGVAQAILASVFYMYAPYHAVQIYVRGAVGEYWAYAFIPLLFYGLWGVRNTSNRRHILVGGIGLAGIIVSHTITGFVVTCGLGIYTVVLLALGAMKKRSVVDVMSLIRFILLGVGLSAFFWLPAFFEKQFTSVEGMVWDTTDYRDHFVCLPQLWNSLWGFGGSAKGCVDGLSFKVGKLHVIGAFVGLFTWIAGKKMKWNSLFIPTTIVFFLSLFMTLQISESVWKLIPFSGYIQYPWRFLTYVAFGSSVLASGVLFVKQRLMRIVFVLIVVIAVVFVNAKVFTVQYSYKQPSLYFENREDLRFRVSKISDEYLPPQIKRPVSENDIVRGTIVQGQDIRVESEYESSTYNKYPVIAPKTTEIVIQKAYFPGFRYLVNGKVQKPVLVDGLPHLTVPEGRSVVEIFFDNTPVRTLGFSFIIYIW
jgi:hypothetical protein